MEGSRQTAEEVVRRVYGAGRDFLDGNEEEAARVLTELVSPSVVLTPSSALPSGSIGPYRGLQGCFEWLDAVGSLWESFEVHCDEFIELSAGTLMVLARTVASRAGERGYAATVTHVWRVEAGQVVELAAFESQARALEHAGVRRRLRARGPDEQP